MRNCAFKGYCISAVVARCTAAMLDVLPAGADSAPVDCAVCLCAAVEPVRWPSSSSCMHTFCERCCLSVLERGGVQCPLCRSPVESSLNVGDLLLRKTRLVIDTEVAAASRALAPDEYDERLEADSAAITSSVERRLKEDAEGTELMLFCMGRLSLHYGQRIGVCLFEPRYRMMIANALEKGGKFGIVIDSCGFVPGARGRVASIIFQRRRPDGCYDVRDRPRLFVPPPRAAAAPRLLACSLDRALRHESFFTSARSCHQVVVAVGAAFTVSQQLWAVAPPNAPPTAPPLMHTRARIEAEDEDDADDVNGASGRSGSTGWRRALGRRTTSRSPSASPVTSPLFARRAPRQRSSRSSMDAPLIEDPDPEALSTPPRSPIDSASPDGDSASGRARMRSRAARSAAAISAVRSLRHLLANALSGANPRIIL